MKWNTMTKEERSIEMRRRRALGQSRNNGKVRRKYNSATKLDHTNIDDLATAIVNGQFDVALDKAIQQLSGEVQTISAKLHETKERLERAVQLKRPYVVDEKTEPVRDFAKH